MQYYRLYGLNMASPVRVHGLDPIAPVSVVDVQVHDQATPPNVPLNGAHWIVDPDRLAYTDDAPEAFRAMPLRWTRDGAYVQWRMMRYIAMIFARGGEEVYTRWSPAVSPTMRAFNLVTAGMGMILRLRRETVLHASVIRIGDGAVAFAGNSGVGKSTLAAFFERIGLAVMSDDLCVLRQDSRTGEFLIPTGVPRIRLMHDAAVALYGGNAQLSAAPDGGKLERDLHWHAGEGLIPDQFPLKAVYIIAGRGHEGSIVRLEAAPSVLAMSRHLYLRYMADAVSKALDFSAIAAVARRVPVYEMVIPNGLHKLERLCRALAAQHR